MDALGLQTLARELEADVVVVVAAIDLAGLRFAEATPSGHDSAAHHLSRACNVIEQMALRVARVFENNVDDQRGWHAELIRRLSIRIVGVRPPLFTTELRQPLQELRAFRHVFVHAYDLTIDPERLRLVLKYADVVRERIPGLVSGVCTQSERTEAAVSSVTPGPAQRRRVSVGERPRRRQPSTQVSCGG